MRTVKGAPFYDNLIAYVGKTVTVHCDRKKHTNTLHLWTAKNGNEGWLVANDCPADGSLPSGGYTVFSGEIVDKIVIDLFGLHVYI